MPVLPIPIPMAVAVYFTMWWVVLFAVLPFGVRSQHETGTIVPGSEPGAPEAPRLLRKALWTTLVSAVLFAALMGLMAYFPDA
jgi:predicted secreted protein